MCVYSITTASRNLKKNKNKKTQKLEAKTERRAAFCVLHGFSSVVVLIGEKGAQQPVSGPPGAQLASAHAPLVVLEQGAHARVRRKAVLQLVVHHLVHPGRVLGAAAQLKLAAGVLRGRVALQRGPDVVQAGAGACRAQQRRRRPRGRLGPKDVQRGRVVAVCTLGGHEQLAVGLVDNHCVGELDLGGREGLRFFFSLGIF